MKKITLISTLIIMLILSAFSTNSQSYSKDYILIGKSVVSYNQMGTDFQFVDNKRVNISLYIGTEKKTFILTIKDEYILGIYDVYFYNKKGKEIKLEDVSKMTDRGKLDHYLFISNLASNGNDYSFYIPYELNSVKILETENNKNYMYYFEVVDVHNGPPDLPSINKNQR